MGMRRGLGWCHEECLEAIPIDPKAKAREDKRKAEDDHELVANVMCINDKCNYYMDPRTVSRPYLGKDIWMQGDMVCACSWTLLTGVGIQQFIAQIQDQKHQAQIDAKKP
jgi:hypothetical protein